jgi:type I restriction enzyme S subunit
MITKDAVESFVFLCPSEKERDTISNILWQIENKINLLRRQNSTLEKMAETLFRQWFVEDVKEDWEMGTVLDLFKLQRGFDLPTHQRISGKYKIITSSGVNGTHSKYKIKGPGVTTGRSGMIGNVYFIDEDFWPLNTSLFIIEFKRATPLFAFQFLKNLDLANLNAGSAVPTLNRNDVHMLETELPPRELIKKYDNTVNPFFKKIKFNEIQISTLTTLRETLLPKLMSGEVRVNVKDVGTKLEKVETKLK